MICEHLAAIEALAVAAGIAETARGHLWSGAAGEWVYYDCLFDRAAIEARGLPAGVAWHEHLGTHDGTEAGFVCEPCGTGVMGLHPRTDRAKGAVVCPLQA
jgi:hypothetical protein